MDYIIEMLGITKTFPGIIANDDVTLQVKPGEIHALLGENGAGKSTLMNVLFGLYQQDAGTIRLRDKEVDIDGPRAANDLGIGMVHQHFKLVEDFTVLQNIVLGAETVNKGLLQMDAARQRVLELSERYGLRVEPDSIVAEISVGMQQRVEILKMLYRDNEVLILDEPTAVLTPQEIDEMMDIMRGLVQEGKSIIFITHKLDELKAVADRCTVLRRGKLVGVVDVAATDKETLSEMMVGRKVDLSIDLAPNDYSSSVLQVDKLLVQSRRLGQIKNVVNNVSFSVGQGEIVCIAGIDGNGQTELVNALTGLAPIDGGKVLLNNEDISTKSIRYKNTHGLGHIPEDRQKHGLVLEFPLGENLVLQEYFDPRFQRHGFLRYNNIYRYAQQLIDTYDIRSGQGAWTPARNMSGGNQQKAIVAREVDRDPDLLIAVQPTRGLDVGAIEYIHQRLVEQRDAGKAVLLVSLELDEVMSLSDRILVIYQGEIVADLDPKQTSERELGLYMAGSKVQKAKAGGQVV